MALTAGRAVILHHVERAALGLPEHFAEVESDDAYRQQLNAAESGHNGKQGGPAGDGETGIPSPKASSDDQQAGRKAGCPQ